MAGSARWRNTLRLSHEPLLRMGSGIETSIRRYPVDEPVYGRHFCAQGRPTHADFLAVPSRVSMQDRRSLCLFFDN